MYSNINKMNLKFAPHVQTFIDKLQEEFKFGVGTENIEIVNPKSGSPRSSTNDLCDIFRLIIPFGGQQLQWEVIFLQNHPDLPPDFIFDDHQFMPDILDIDSLRDWKPDDPESLLHAVTQLLSAYKQESISRLESNSRLHFEYNSLLQQRQMADKDIEVMLNRKNRNTTVSFRIRLNVNFSDVPMVFSEKSLKDECAFLTVTFQTPEGGKVTPKLHLSPALERILGGGYFSHNLPSFPVGGCLMDYVPSVEQFLADKVVQLVKCFEKRVEYFSAILDMFGMSILEYDAEKHSQLSFLFEWNDFFFIVHVTIPQAFPQEKPKLQFQSIYTCIHGQPFKFNTSSYSYSPRWSGLQMARQIRTVILECVSEFQKSSLKDM